MAKPPALMPTDYGWYHGGWPLRIIPTSDLWTYMHRLPGGDLRSEVERVLRGRRAIPRRKSAPPVQPEK